MAALRKSPDQRQAEGTESPREGLLAAASFLPRAVHEKGNANGLPQRHLAGRGRPASSFDDLPVRKRLTARIIAAYHEHPEWNGKRIATHVGCMPHHVRSVLSENSLRLRGFEALGRAARAAGFTLAELRDIAAAKRRAAE